MKYSDFIPVERRINSPEAERFIKYIEEKLKTPEAQKTLHELAESLPVLFIYDKPN